MRPGIHRGYALTEPNTPSPLPGPDSYVLPSVSQREQVNLKAAPCQPVPLPPVQSLLGAGELLPL